MGYLNNVTGYREDLLANRAIVKHGNFALLTPDGLVKNIIPGFENCDATILSTPKLGASFVDYLVTLHQNGGNQQGFGGEGIETFLYVISGNITAKAEGKTFTLSEGGYLYCPPGSLMTFVNAQAEDSQIFLYKRRYIPVEGHIETHVQEHGAYILSGQGVYNLDNNWIPVKKGDYIFMGAYSLQAGYGVGRGEAFSYIYSKDCNRDVEI